MRGRDSTVANSLEPDACDLKYAKPLYISVIFCLIDDQLDPHTAAPLPLTPDAVTKLNTATMLIVQQS